MGELQWESSQGTEEQTWRWTGDMKVYWDLHAGSPGADGWMRLCFAMVNREGIAYMGDGTKTMYVPVVKGQRLCALLEGIILV